MASFFLSFDQIRGDLRSAGFFIFSRSVRFNPPKHSMYGISVYLPVSTIKINQM